MYVVRVLYPRTVESTFNLRHYLDVHTPLGLGLLKKIHGVSPVKVEVDVEALPLGTDPAPFHCASHIYFEDLSDVEAFKALFAQQDVAQQLIDDFPNYTTNPPVISISEVRAIDPVRHVPL